ncbi:MAG TPA: hypothetical protein TECP_01141 [Hyphomicrobiaceae bacterium MAG_BT-2024]
MVNSQLHQVFTTLVHLKVRHRQTAILMSSINANGYLEGGL